MKIVQLTRFCEGGAAEFSQKPNKCDFYYPLKAQPGQKMKFTSQEHEIAFYIENVETQDFDEIFEVNILKISFDDDQSKANFYLVFYQINPLEKSI